MSKRVKVFVSSRMMELAEERRVLARLLPDLSDESFQISTWVFEADALASANSIRRVYLDALEQSDIYLGIYWNGYGEYTVDEFHRAGEIGIPRLVYVKNVEADQRDPRLTNFLESISDVRFGVTPRWYQTTYEFEEQVSRAIRVWLQNQALAYHSSTNAILATIADEIPELPRKLIGRTRLIQRVLNLLDDYERVLLRGFGGTGKTAIAASIAADYLDDGKGDVIWIKTGTANADAIFEALGRLFDEQQVIMSAKGDARDHAMRKLLARHNGLLVLDDVWNANALARVAHVLPRKMPLLATSRQKYPLDEVIEIGELEPDEAVKLLDYHARKGLTQSHDVMELCDKLGNHAFALEVAGKTLKVYDISPEELLRRIAESPHDLDMPAGFGELGRTGIKSLLDVTIDALDRELYDTYVAMGGMFEPTATAELIQRTTKAEPEKTVNTLDELVQRGLLNERQMKTLNYYQLHDLAYSYARATFTSKGLSFLPVIQACREFTVDHADDLGHLDIEISNILEAAETAYELDDNETFLAILNALTVSGAYFVARGHTNRTLELLRLAIDVAEKAEQIDTAHFLWSKLGNTYAGYLAQYDLALDAYQHALNFAQQMKNPQREATLLTVIGTVRFRQRADDFDTYHQQAETIAREHDDTMVLAQVLHNRGANALEKDTPYFDAKRGRDLSNEAVTLAKTIDNTQLHFYSLLNRGAGEHELGDYEQALATHGEAHSLAMEVEYHPWIADTQYSMGEDLHALGQRDEAQQCFDEALHLYQTSGWKAKVEQLTQFMEDNNYRIAKEKS